jgi:hypothetical protein
LSSRSDRRSQPSVISVEPTFKCPRSNQMEWPLMAEPSLTIAYRISGDAGPTLLHVPGAISNLALEALEETIPNSRSIPRADVKVLSRSPIRQTSNRSRDALRLHVLRDLHHFTPGQHKGSRRLLLLVAGETAAIRQRLLRASPSIRSPPASKPYAAVRNTWPCCTNTSMPLILRPLKEF